MQEKIVEFTKNEHSTIWSIIAVGIVIVMLFCNKKVRLNKLLKEQMAVFKNDKNKKISVWDIFCFVIFPIVLAMILVYALDKPIYKQLANTLTTIFSLVFTILFGFIAILIGKIDDPNNNGRVRQVVIETFTSIISSTLLALFGTVAAIVITAANEGNKILISVLSCGVYSAAFMIVMLILMTTKRIFLIYKQ